jgi:transposase
VLHETEDHDEIVERIAALDIGKAEVVSCVRVPSDTRAGRRMQEVQTHSTMTRSLLAMADRFRDLGVTRVVVEATSDYWKPPFYLLEAAGLETWLVNARDVKHLPGRPKTDKLDAVWLCKVAERQMIRPSFVPPPEIRRLRDLTRLRKAQTNERARTIQRLEKVLQDAGIKLSSVASTTYSKSARAMLEALLSGVTDPEALAELAKSRMRAKIPQLREALASRFEIEHHGVMVAQLLAHIDTLDAAIENLNERIELALARHAQIVELLCTIPGVQTHAAQVLIAECGLDMTCFPTVSHFASWAGACPGHHESAGRRRSGQTRPGPRWLTDALTEAAKAAARTKGTYLAAHFAQLRGRRGEPKAIGAIRHDILVAYYHIVRDQVPFRELGPDWQRKRYSVEHRARRLQRQLEALGYKVTVEATAEVQAAA